MPLVLVHNDVVANPAHQWDDVEGVRYHYPAKYRGKIRTGEPFVYYRGVHRADGKRGPAQYVGAGRIGEIWADTERKNAWYCAIEEYQRFAHPVPAKINGANREVIPANLWRDGVRVLNEEVHQAILEEGLGAASIAKVPSANAQARLVDDLILPPAAASQQPPPSDYRQSKRAKEIGDWAERAVFDHLSARYPGAEIRHCALLGEKPGWDLEYRLAGAPWRRVEVKGTTSAAFAGVLLTANELRAAQAHGDDYWLCLVARCETEDPEIQMIHNPAARLASGAWSAEPSLYHLRFAPSPAGEEA